MVQGLDAAGAGLLATGIGLYVVRGDVHAIKLPPRRGRVQHGRRYAVVVQADALLVLSTLFVCPTSRSAPEAGPCPNASPETRIATPDRRPGR